MNFNTWCLVAWEDWNLAKLFHLAKKASSSTAHHHQATQTIVHADTYQKSAIVRTKSGTISMVNAFAKSRSASKTSCGTSNLANASAFTTRIVIRSVLKLTSGIVTLASASAYQKLAEQVRHGTSRLVDANALQGLTVQQKHHTLITILVHADACHSNVITVSNSTGTIARATVNMRNVEIYNTSTLMTVNANALLRIAQQISTGTVPNVHASVKNQARLLASLDLTSLPPLASASATQRMLPTYAVPPNSWRLNLALASAMIQAIAPLALSGMTCSANASAAQKCAPITSSLTMSHAHASALQ